MVFELVYFPDGIDKQGYHSLAFSLDKAKLTAIIDEVRAMDKAYLEWYKLAFENDLPTDDDFSDFELPENFVLKRISGFDEESFFMDYDGDCAEKMMIFKRELL